ncbi:hypothetical protein G6F57_008061 [Rhizopus arrhizus]|uniref:Peroxisomal membrane protein PEX14 n=1 Tax=Rhizopus oryzae TaxID=64495 RepID=A0A9P6XIN1_RHIOR|nr:hypothetical protein G6F23_002258 [Rhizopus arrhizus]KAG1414228.1 hypothetical protein G6F58_007060 [Rhizopus delemar]KAG0762246.1 hypothetical protein G6F24_006940 [Rhizopus arrhizus]KAG0788699.1 hypothetical protein G6F21_007033 [Rhizopus arrhizus]KAG0810689.1 hypothetical protein G6F20_007763 [Rhizopus arrhizus]
MRKELLESAISFLSSPNVQTADKEKKIQFLKKKNLTDEEIEYAFKQIEKTSQVTTLNKPNVPARYQVLYYSTEPTIARLTTQQITRLAIILGLGAVGITSILLIAIKQYMSRIFRSIAGYQSNRYKDHTKFLKRIESKLKEQQTESTFTEFINKQKSLGDYLLQLSSSIKTITKQDDKYKHLRSAVDDLHHTFTKLPHSNSNHFSYGGFASSYTYHSSSSFKGDDDNDAAIQSLKSEIRSFKGTLLSRRNFPTITTSLNTIKSPAISPQTASTEKDFYHPRRRRSFRSELATDSEKMKSAVEK